MSSVATKEEALTIAKGICETKNWPWLEPVNAKENCGVWKVTTNFGKRGANVRITISKQDGAVRKAVFGSR